MVLSYKDKDIQDWLTLKNQKVRRAMVYCFCFLLTWFLEVKWIVYNIICLQTFSTIGVKLLSLSTKKLLWLVAMDQSHSPKLSFPSLSHIVGPHRHLNRGWIKTGHSSHCFLFSTRENNLYSLTREWVLFHFFFISN